MPFAMFGLLKNWKLIGIGAGIVALTLSVWAGYAHYQGLLLKVDDLTKANEQVRMTTQIQATHLDQQRSALHEWKQAQDELINNYHELSKVAAEARNETGRLHDLFSKHNFSALASKKPGLIETRVNHGTRTILRLFECETGNSASCNRNSPTGPKAGSPKP